VSADTVRPTRRPILIIVTAVVVVGIAVLAYVLFRPSGLSPDLQAVHDATAQFDTVDAVEAAGYGELLDADGIACIDHGDQGGMGIHYVHGDLVGDALLDPQRPEAIIYEPGASGSMDLVGVEYVVFQEAWDAANDAPPTLFGQPLTAVGADNRYGIPAFYELHAWVWKDNPAGRFADYNPDVSCAHAHAIGDMTMDEPAAPAAAPAVTAPRARLGGW
jgi:hypothetical protein